MYHVAGTGITILILYLISYLFSRFGYFSIAQHKKFWNIILAVAFLVSAFAGIFMALQISYKWNIPNVKTILKWHVEFGAGLAATGLLHFIWHLSYFGRNLSEKNSDNNQSENTIVSDSGTSGTGTNLFVVGFVSSSLQFLLIREMMNISGGFELITGIFLGTWLLLSSASAGFAGRSALMDTGRINLIFSLSPIVSIFLMFFISKLFLESGETPSVLVSIIYTLLVLMPFCISSGFIFVKLIYAARNTSGNDPGKSFSRETSGGILSGILISLLVSEDIGTYKLILVIILLSAAYTLLTFYITKNLTKLITKILVMFAVSVFIISDPDVLFRQIMLPGIIVTESRDTPYGNITTGSYQNEKSVYYNQRLIKYSNDAIEREEDIHYAMLQHRAPQNILVISGSFDSHIPEILKYPVEKIVYIERDPALASLIKTDTLNEKIIVANTDAYSYIRKTKEKKDVIIMLVPPPSNLLLNRYYTRDFFVSIKKVLDEGGVFMCSPGAGENYYNDESLNLNSSIFNSLGSVFRNVIPVAGNKLYFIASDSPLTTEFCKLISENKIANLYVSSDYLSDDLTERKSKEIKTLLNPSIKPNTTELPLAYSYFQSYQLSKNKNEKIITIILFTGLFAYTLLSVKKRNLTMYFSASALAGFEVISLLALQMTVGNMYQMTGLIIAGLMAGLATGSGFSFRVISKISLPMKGVCLACFYFSTGLFYNYFLQIENSITATLLILVFTFIPAFITGNIFRELTIKDFYRNNTSGVYSADLSGSAMGFIAVAGFTIPSSGIIITLYFLGTLVFTGILFGTILNKH